MVGFSKNVKVGLLLFWGELVIDGCDALSQDIDVLLNGLEFRNDRAELTSIPSIYSLSEVIEERSFPSSLITTITID